jgi:putative hydrolase of the HAD superfamily
MRAVIFGYFGTLTDPGAEEYREPSRTAPASCCVCRQRFWEAPAGSFGERAIEVHGGTESTLRAVAFTAERTRHPLSSPSRSRITGAGHALLRKPRHHALGVLAELWRRGLRIALFREMQTFVEIERP